jgi:hypothetical protein
MGRRLADRSEGNSAWRIRVPISVFEDDAGLGERCGVGERNRGAGYAKVGSDLRGAAVEAEGRPAGEFADHFNLEPGDTEADAGAEGFGASFFGREAGGEAFRRFAFAEAVGLLRGGVDAIEQARPEALNGAMDAVNLDQVDSGSDDHSFKLHDAERGRQDRARECLWCATTCRRVGRSNYLQGGLGAQTARECFKDGQMPFESCTEL